jgi:putative tricarboxylic transport membrane protein
MFADMLAGIMMIFRIDLLGFIILGVILGIVVGAIPGLTATMAIAILLPFSFFLPPLVGIPFLVAISKGAMFGGGIPAVLINTPGTGAAVPTTFDGYPLARQGKARKALEMVLWASVCGEMFGSVVTLFGTSLLASIALWVGAPEITALIFMSFMLIIVLSGESILKGLISGLAGFWLSTIGLDPLTGVQRYTFGSGDLAGGLSPVTLVIGLFAIAEILRASQEKISNRELEETIFNSLKRKEEGLTYKEFRACGKTIVRSSIIGTIVGIIPGIDQVVAAFVSYGVAKGSSKHPETFGKGELEGVAACESGDNAANCPIFMPLLVFGIPGGVIAAIVLGAFMVHGLRPGPRLMETQGPLVYGILWAWMLSTLVLLGIGLLTLRFVARVARFPLHILFPPVAGLCLVGSYCVNNSMMDVFTAVVFGVIGYVMTEVKIPIGPLVITFILGPIFETALGQALIMGGPTIFLQRPIALGFLVLTPFVLIYLVKRIPKL